MPYRTNGYHITASADAWQGLRPLSRVQWEIFTGFLQLIYESLRIVSVSI